MSPLSRTLMDEIAGSRAGRWQGWGVSLGLHAALLSGWLLASFLMHRPAPEASLFQWEVNLVQPAPQQKAPAETPVQQTVQEFRPIRRQIVQSQVVTKPVSVEQTPVPLETQVQVDPPQDISQQVVDQMEVSQETGSPQPIDTQPVNSPPQVQEQATLHEIDEELEEVVEERGEAVARPMIETRADPQPIDQEQTVIRQAETVTTAPVSTGTVQAHYGWLKADLMHHIERLKRYPQHALENKWEGRVVVRAVIWDNGSLTDLSIVESSGYDVLDRASLELVKRISPVPLKQELGAPHVTLRIPISYGIR